MKKIMSTILAFAVTAMCAVPSFANSPERDGIQTETVVSVAEASAETAEEGETKLCSEVIEETSGTAVSAQPIEDTARSGVAGTNTDAPKAEEEIPEEDTEDDAADPTENGETAEDTVGDLDLGEEYFDGVLENGEVIDTDEEQSAVEKYFEDMGTFAAFGAYDLAMGIALPVVMGLGGTLMGVCLGVLPVVIFAPAGFAGGVVCGIPMALTGAVMLIGSPIIPMFTNASDWGMGI